MSELKLRLSEKARTLRSREELFREFAFLVRRAGSERFSSGVGIHYG
jgi:hypothetical protein